MNDHIIRSFDDELAQLSADVARMGGLAEAQVAACIEAMAKRDVALALAIVARDDRLDAMELEIEQSCTRLVALRQPVANDLRRTLSAIKIAGSLERCGDLAKSIAKSTLRLNEIMPVSPLTGPIERMGRLVIGRLHDVLDAYTTGDIDRAIAVWSSDLEVDEYYSSLFRELLTYMMGDPRMITACINLLFVAKNLERIGDHATNIAEAVHYELTGKFLPQPRPKGTDP